MKLILACAAMMISSGAFAQGDEVDCKNPMTQPEMNICAANDAADADAELNRVWKEARTYVAGRDKEFQNLGDQPGMEKALLAAQRNWIAFRDDNCEVAGYQVQGGSMQPMVIEGCLAAMTRARTKELKDMIEGVP